MSFPTLVQYAEDRACSMQRRSASLYATAHSYRDIVVSGRATLLGQSVEKLTIEIVWFEQAAARDARAAREALFELIRQGHREPEE